jgi:hypothetical protein
VLPAASCPLPKIKFSNSKSITARDTKDAREEQKLEVDSHATVGLLQRKHRRKVLTLLGFPWRPWR